MTSHASHPPIPSRSAPLRAARLLACHDCDALQHLPEHAGTRGLECWRCGSLLVRAGRLPTDSLLALMLAVAVCYLIAMSYPILALSANGHTNATTLVGAAGSLWDQNSLAMAVLVFATTVLVPALDIAVMLYLLVPLWLRERGLVGRFPPYLTDMLRLAQRARSWSMLEVFMMGTLVAFVKLSHIAKVEAGVAIWAFAAMIVLMAIFTNAFHPRDVWKHLERVEQGA